jgi:hypothetical protein
MMMLYVPWSNKNPIDFSDKLKTIAKFESLIQTKKLPTAVIAQYTRAKYYQKHEHIEVVAKKMTPLEIDQDNDEDEYSEYRVYARAMNHFTNSKPVPCSIGDMSFNVGTHHNWTHSSSTHIKRNVTLLGDYYMEWIKKAYSKSFSTNKPTYDNRFSGNNTPVRTLLDLHCI